MTRILSIIAAGLLLTGCFSAEMQKELSKAIKEGAEGMKNIMKQDQFKTALYEIEMYKLRNGKYPESIYDLEYLNHLDSNYLEIVDYTVVEGGYELDYWGSNQEVVMGNDTIYTRTRIYPPAFWQGLGCVRSNQMDNAEEDETEEETTE